MVPSERLKGIEAFVATADAGSFTAAATRLNLTNSAVGKSIARLEARLNTRLFERTTRRMTMTQAGTAFYKVCVRVLAELEAAEQVLAQENLVPAGPLRVDLPATFGRSVVMPVLLAFGDQYPAVRLNVSFTDRFVDVMEAGIDVAVRIGGPEVASPGLCQRLLGTERLIFCASPDYLKRRGMPQHVDALGEHDAVTYGLADGTPSAWRIVNAAGMIERRAVQGKVVLGNAEAQVSAVASGWGVAQLATWLVEDALREGRLVQVLPQQAPDGLKLFLIWPASRERLPKVQRLIEALEGSLGIS